MTEPTAKAQENKSKGEAPIIRGYTREGQTPAELTLWINTPTAKDGEEPSPNAPDFRGYVQVGQERTYVSAWAYSSGVSDKVFDENGVGKAFPPYLSLAASIKQPDGTYTNESLSGSIKGMFRTTVNGEKIEVDGSRGLKVIGQLTGTSILKEGITVTGNLNGRFHDQETLLGLATSLGFADAPVNGFKAYMDKDAKKAAAPAM